MTTDADLSEVRDDAVHGSFCPKMCNFSCPVTAATGREAFTPWGLHVTVSELATERRDPDRSTYAALVGCTGCHACRDACLYDQDVPEQVRAARTAHDGVDVHPSLAGIRRGLLAGRSPYGVERPTQPDGSATADLQLVAGCRDEPDVLAAATALFHAAGHDVRPVVPDGCCGAVARDLGLRDTAVELRARLRDGLDPAVPTVATDPHCLPILRTIVDAPVRDSVSALDTALAAGSLDLDETPSTTVTYHDPCLSSRDEGVVDPPRSLLRSAGIAVSETPRSGRRTACSGAGLAMDLLDPDVAGAVAARRAEQLAGEHPVVTACARAGALLAAAGVEIRDIHTVLADRLPTRGPP